LCCFAAPGLDLVGKFRPLNSAPLLQIGEKFVRGVHEDIVACSKKNLVSEGNQVVFEVAPPRKWRYRSDERSRANPKEYHAFTVYLLDGANRCIAIKDSPIFQIESAWKQDGRSVSRPFQLGQMTPPSFYEQAPVSFMAASPGDIQAHTGYAGSPHHMLPAEPYFGAPSLLAYQQQQLYHLQQQQQQSLLQQQLSMSSHHPGTFGNLGNRNQDDEGDDDDEDEEEDNKQGNGKMQSIESLMNCLPGMQEM